jgi:hypothetical protein
VWRQRNFAYIRLNELWRKSECPPGFSIPILVVLCDFSCRTNKLFENNKCVVSFCDSCRWMSFADEYSKVSVWCVRSVYSLSCVVDVRFRLQKPYLMIYDFRFFLTKQQTFLRLSLLYTIYYSVLMNVFRKLGNYTRILEYTNMAK